jgi:hypothetical protein
VIIYTARRFFNHFGKPPWTSMFLMFNASITLPQRFLNTSSLPQCPQFLNPSNFYLNAQYKYFLNASNFLQFKVPY